MQPPDEKCNSKGYGGITVPIEHPRCPKCGSILLFNGNLVWCPFVGSSEEKACDFGIYRNITRNEATVLWWKSLDVGQRLTDDQIATLLGGPPNEEVKNKGGDSINESADLRQRLASQREEARMWKERAECMIDLVNAALAVADSIKLWEGGKTATASPPLCADLLKLATLYASKSTEEIRSDKG